MTKLRNPDTIEDTVSLAIGLLGEARVCEVAARKSSLVKAWADPDDDKRSISLRASIAIDRELVRCGHQPIFSQFHANAVTPQSTEQAEVAGKTPLEHAMRVVGEAADTLEDTATAFKDSDIDAGERMRLKNRAVRLMQQLGQFNRSLFVKGDKRR